MAFLTIENLMFIDNNHAFTKQYIVGISNTINKRPTYYDSVKSAINDLENSLLDDYFYIIHSDQLLYNVDIINKLMSYKYKNIVILYETIDKKSNLYKEFETYFVEFKQFDKYALYAYTKKLCKDHKCSIDQDKIFKLIDYCNCDLGILLNELDKIFILEQENSNILVDYMLENGFSDYRKFNVYNFISRVMSKDLSAFNLLYKIDDSTVGIIYSLYTTARKKFLDTKNTYFINVMKISMKTYQSIMNGSIDQKYALKLILSSLY